jgi:large subunit ribosomal protein L24e
MAVIQKCTFCGTAIPTGTGKLYIRKDAKMIWLCSNKCEKNMNKLGRKDRETRWTEAYAQDKRARMAAAAHHVTDDAAPSKKPAAKKKAAGSKK